MTKKYDLSMIKDSSDPLSDDVNLQEDQKSNSIDLNMQISLEDIDD